MNTLAEVEKAADALPIADQRKLLLHIAEKIRAAQPPAPEPREFTSEQIAGWIAQDEADMAELDAEA